MGEKKWEGRQAKSQAVLDVRAGTRNSRVPNTCFKAVVLISKV